ncbi:DNRLRE domain-containing protein [Sphaerisporangium fuscum]|uniref:DNRLRE domain-containing protein n=1 Tax=Sphaerisporangium fuscum TaxID=2835868 RepID=UPI001BDDC164|nr:DNRLRE domain-containing protein [Sphaerisporangium fuscum]
MKKSRRARGDLAGRRAVMERRGVAVTGLAVLMVAASLTGQAAMADDATPQPAQGPALGRPGQSPATPRPGQAATTSQPGRTAATSAPDDRAVAVRAAKAQGKRVEVESEKSDSSSLWANPDGTFTMETFPGPVRVKDGGAWRPIDTSLVRDGRAGLRPKRTASEVQVSGGGGKPFAEVRRADRSFAVSWGKDLPEPQVKGDTATYKDVVPGGDLTVKALPNGFSHSLVLRERPTGPLEITLPVATRGLNLSEAADNGLNLQDGSGNLLASAPAPRMWDATTDPRSGEPVHQAAIDTTVKRTDQGVVLMLRPDAGFLADPAVKYPVTVDPTSTLTVETDTWVQSDIPDSQRGSTELKAGTYDGTHVARSYLEFRHVDDLRGAQIMSSDLRLWTFWSSVCVDPSAGVQARRVTAAWDPDTIKYGSEPATTTAGAVTTKAAYGAASCPQDFMHWNTAAIAQAWADGQPNYGIQLRGADEKDASTWRRYYSSNYVSGAQGEKEPALSVTFAYKLPTPTGLDVTPRASTDPAINTVASLTPTLSAKATDPSGKPLDYTFEVTEAGDSDVIATGGPKGVASGATATWKVPANILRNPGSYRFRVRVTSETGASGWSSWTPLATDVPKAPTALATGAADLSDVVLSGVVMRPSGGWLSARYYLFDSAGTAVGASPLGTSDVQDGQRAALKVSPDLLTPGSSYTWQMEACVETACGARSAPVRFTAPQPAAAKPTQTKTLDAGALTVRAARTASDACGGNPCALESVPALQVGGGRISMFKVDLSAIPAGAEVTSATLDIGPPTCASTCPTTKVSAYELTGDLAAEASGADASAKLLEEPFAEVDPADPKIDITGSVQGDRQDGQGFAELALRASDPAAPETSFGSATIAVTYVPPGVPGALQTISVRPGDGGALITWGPPAESAGDMRITGFDLEVLDGSGKVVQAPAPAEPRAVVTGLTNGEAYTVRVRGKNEQGVGAWSTPTAVKPQAVPDRQEYVDAVAQYLDSREGIVEGRFADAADAIAKHAQGYRFESLLQADEQELLTAKSKAEVGGGAQESSTATLADPLVSLSADGTVATVRATVHQNRLVRDETGEKTTEEEENAADYSFNVKVTGQGQRVDGSADGLAGRTDGDSVDAQVYPEGSITTDMTEEGTVPEPTDTPGGTVSATGVSASSINQSGIASWALRNVNSHQEYDNFWHRGGDCTNFASKALRFGGGAWEIRNYGRTAKQKRENMNNWFWAAPVGKDSNTFIMVDKSMSHMANRHRIQWRSTFAEVRVGDIMYWDRDPWRHDGPEHMSIVTKKTANNENGIYYTAHSVRRKNHRVSSAKESGERIGYARLVL